MNRRYGRRHGIALGTALGGLIGAILAMSSSRPEQLIRTESVALVFWGSPNRVADQILAFREEIGDFGTLLLAGKDWKDRTLGRRSMELLAEKVMPQVNAAIGKSKVAAE